LHVSHLLLVELLNTNFKYIYVLILMVIGQTTSKIIAKQLILNLILITESNSLAISRCLIRYIFAEHNK